MIPLYLLFTALGAVIAAVLQNSIMRQMRHTRHTQKGFGAIKFANMLLHTIFIPYIESHNLVNTKNLTSCVFPNELNSECS